MEKETGYIENTIKKICTDKSRVISLVFSVLSAICTTLYITCTGTSGIHFVFVIAMLLAAVANIVYVIDVDNKIKHSENILLSGIGLMTLGLILKVIRVGIAFSVVYVIGYFIYALTFLLLSLYCAKNESTPKIIKVLLAVGALWSLIEFFSLSNYFLVGIIWKIFRISEAFLAIGYLFTLNIIEKLETPFSDQIGEFKKQIPSFKICAVILLAISIISAGVGFVVDMDNSTTTVTKETQIIDKTKESKKSTITSTVISDETAVEEIEEIKIGDKIETDNITFKLNKVEITRRVQPDNPPSYYTYYQSEKDHTYIYVNASITNKDKYSLDCDEIYSVTADFDGGYKYNGFNIADDYDGDFTYANITSIEPLETLGVHSLVDCPQLIEDEGKPLFITITLNNGEKYKYTIKGE